MAGFIRAGFGVAIALYALDPIAGASWLKASVVAPIQARCEAGLTRCGGDPVADLRALVIAKS